MTIATDKNFLFIFHVMQMTFLILKDIKILPEIAAYWKTLVLSFKGNLDKKQRPACRMTNWPLKVFEL